MREIQAELVPERAAGDVPEPGPARESGPPADRGPSAEPEPPAEPASRGRSGPLASALARAPRGSGDAERQLDQINELTAVYADLLVSLRELLETHPPAEVPTPAGELVTLSTGPFGTIGAVRAFERRLAALPGVDDVHLRGYEGDDRAVFDVRLEGDSS